MSSTTSAKTIFFVMFLLNMVSQTIFDNGPQYTSGEFHQFFSHNGIRHTRTAPYHPATNGLTERFVQTFNKAISVGRRDGRTSKHKLATFFLHYRTTPHLLTGHPRSVLFNDPSSKTDLALLKPDIIRVQDGQEVQKSAYDHHTQENFEINDSLMVRIHWDNHQYWEPRIITETISQVSFVVKLEDDTSHHCHMDQLCKMFSSSGDSSNDTPDQ
uniref:Integrase catalytic domain-containing protein n=1 Tax=Amphimedon queenslandica TaxID=400682 RepID=A0A1X7V6S7_AMPQE